MFFHLLLAKIALAAPSGRLRFRLLAIGMLGLAFGSSELCGQVPGDRVVVTSSFESKIGSNVVGRVEMGEIHTVLAVDKKWVALEGVRGWVAAQNLMSLSSARMYFQQRIAANKRDFDAIACLGMIQFEQGELVPAFTQMNEALKLNSGNAALWNWRGIVLNAQRKFVAALADFNEAIKLNPQFAMAFHNRGLTRMELGQMDDAMVDFDKAIELDSQRPDFFTNRGAAWYARGEEQKALSDFDTAINLSKRALDAHVGRGNVFLGRNDFAAAKQEAERALVIEPKSAKALNLRGWIAYRQKDFASARKDFDSAIALATDFPVPLNNRGVLAFDEKRFDDAVADFGRAIELTPEVSFYYTNRGNAWYAQGQFAQAHDDYEKGVELSPQLADAVNGLAWFLATCREESFRKPERALSLSLQLIEKLDGSRDWSCLDTYAAALAANGDFEGAVQQESKAIEFASPEKKASCQDRLKLYQDKKPFFDGSPK